MNRRKSTNTRHRTVVSLLIGFLSGAGLVVLLGPSASSSPLSIFTLSPPALRGSSVALFAAVSERAGVVARAVRAGQPTALAPVGALVAWGGVPTLVFAGFTPSIIRVKAELARTFPGMRAESGGSQFAKTSLGALCPEENCTLTVAELKALRAVCATFAARIARDAWVLPIDDLQFSLYGDRAQRASTRLLTLPLPFSKSTASSSSETAGAAARQHAAEVARPFMEGDLTAYHAKAARGNRLPHYQQRHLGASLVAFWPCYAGGRAAVGGAACAPPWLAQLRREFDAAAPNKFTWFDDGDLHVTIRGLFQLP